MIPEAAQLPNRSALIDAFLTEAMPPEEARKRLERVAVLDFPSGRALLGLKGGERVAAAAEVLVRIREASRASSGTFAFINRRTLLQTLAQRLLRAVTPLSEEDAIALAEAAGQLTGFLLWDAPVGALLTLFESHVAAVGLSAPFREALQKVHRESPFVCGETFVDRMERLLAGEVLRKPTEMEIQPGEAWADTLLSAFADLPEGQLGAWQDLLMHCRSATGSTPSATWLRRAGDLVSKVGPEDWSRIIGQVLRAIGRPGTRPIWSAKSGQTDLTLLDPKQSDLLRGLLWATATVADPPEPHRARALGDAALACFQKIANHGPRDVKVGNACLAALTRIGDLAAALQLSRLLQKQRSGSIRRQVEKALDQVARQAGLTPAEIQEIAVPSLGMREVGVRRETLGDFTAEIRLTGGHGSEIGWLGVDGKVQKAIPAAVRAGHPRELAALRQDLKEMQALLSTQRSRIEQLYLTAASWDLTVWRERYLDHPLVGLVARRLIWRFGAGEEAQLGIAPEGKLVDVRNEPLGDLPGATRVALWHPLESSPAEVLSWRLWLEQHEVRQPFKQAHREIYLVTDAERATGSYSNRFAAHILRQHAFAALAAERGWSYRLQGQWDSWNLPCRSLPEHDLKVEFRVEATQEAEVSKIGVYLYLRTDRVSFRTSSGAPRALAEIERRLFSEVMRDVDLFVGVTSIGNDPEWVEGLYQDYWAHRSFGELDATAETRRDILKRLLPKLKIADRCSLAGRFLIVRGDRRTYKIHLGSGNVLLEPNDQYLCIVASKGAHFFLPFEGDGTLTLILSKALLLAADRTIVDPVILRQLG